MNTVFLLSTGGTIASTANKHGLGIAGSLPGEELMSNVSLPKNISLKVISMFQKPSNALTINDLWTLKNKCQELIDSNEVSGIVITHGTDTLEDTAYFLESTLELKSTSVIVTGSQRVPYANGTDAYSNLEDAIVAAASDKTKGLGVLVSFNQTIFSAAFASKTSSYQLNGFDAPGYGFLGLIDNHEIAIHQKPVRLPIIKTPTNLDYAPEIDIISVYLGASTKVLQAAINFNHATVINGVGRGQAISSWVPIVKKSTQANKPILICSSTLHGANYQSYDYPGSLKDLESAGAISVSNLSARKARMRLIALISNPRYEIAEIKKFF